MISLSMLCVLCVCPLDWTVIKCEWEWHFKYHLNMENILYVKCKISNINFEINSFEKLLWLLHVLLPTKFIKLFWRCTMVASCCPCDNVYVFTSATIGCTITEKAPTRAFSWLKAATTAFTLKTLWRHYAKRSLNMKLGPLRNYHKGRAAIRYYANKTARPLWLLCRGPNFTLSIVS